MGRMRELLIVSAGVLAAASPSLAAGAGREDASGIFVWAFLGFCALIVAAQVVPAVLMMIGAARGVAEGIRERSRVPAEGKAKGV